MASLAVPLVRRVVSGVEQIRAAARLAKLQRNRDLWPYEWVFPPADRERVHQEATADVSTMTAGSANQVLSYQVQNNYRFMFNGIVLLYIGNGIFTPGDGNIVFGVDVNVPIGVTSLQGYPVQGFDGSGIPKGAYASGIYAPYPLAPCPEIIGPSDTLRLKVTPSPGIVASVGRVIAICDGWLLPM